MDWTGEFLVYAVLGDTLTGTLFYQDGIVNMAEYEPAVANAILTILKDGPIHERMSVEIPLCAACREEAQ